MGGSGFAFRQLISANFFIAATAEVLAALLISIGARIAFRGMSPALIVLGAVVLGSSVAQSHGASRLDHRLLLVAVTALHHLGTAGWVGGMLFLMLTLRRRIALPDARSLAKRYSSVALVSVPVLILAGVGMSYFYIGSWGGLYGTTYGIMVLAKTYLMLVMLLLGAGNFQLLRSPEPAAVILHEPAGKAAKTGFLKRLRSFSEAEIGLGITAILAAASLTSQPPAIDLQKDRLTPAEIVERVRWKAPLLTSPSVTALAPPTSMKVAVEESQYNVGYVNDANDRAWSEYNHHWSGMIVLFAGVFAFAASVLPPGRLRKLATNWPLFFIGLGIFIVLRADPENWPLGPRSFWQSFSAPDVLQHRFYALLIVLFAFFEWAVATGRWRAPRAAYVFPLLCAAGGAALLTHSHGISNVKDEMLAELAHTPVAMFGATAGWGRWLQVRLPGTRPARIAGIVWPVCLMVVGLLLLDYRES